jgi:hypothetical protein
MKKILGILAICFVGLFTLVSCGTQNDTPTINELGVNEIQDSGTVLFDIATAKQTRTYTDVDGNSYEYVYTVMVRAQGSTGITVIARNATKLTQYDNYFVVEYCYVDHGDVFKAIEVYSNNMNAYFYSNL